jgi:multiple sugar transport system substrate-binding protein
MFTRKKHYAVLVGLVVLVLVLTACGPAPTPTPVPPTKAAPTPTAQKVTLTWAFWGSPQETATHQKVADAFMAKYPQYSIKIMSAEWGDYHTKMDALFAGGKPEDLPDVMFVAYPTKYATLGALEPLDAYIARDKYDVSIYWPNVLERATINGKIYGFPRDLGIDLLYYNKKIFTAAGVAFPTDKWTWDDFLAAAEKLTVKDASGRVTRYALGMEEGKYWHWPGQMGGGIVDDAANSYRNPSKCMLDTPESKAGIEFMNTLYRKGYLMPHADMQAQGGDKGVFVADQVAMIIQNLSRVSQFTQAGKEFDVAPLPLPKGGQRSTAAGGALWSITAKSLHKDAAWEFVKFLQAPDGGQAIYAASGEILPATRPTVQSDAFRKAVPVNVNSITTEAEGASFVGLPLFPDWDTFNTTIVTPGLQKIWIGEVTPDKGLADLCKQLNDALKQAGYPKK